MNLRTKRIFFYSLSLTAIVLVLLFYYFGKSPNALHHEILDQEITMRIKKGDSKICNTNGGKANDTGLKTWCWGDITLPEYYDGTGVAFSNKELQIASECGVRQVATEGNRLKFDLNPTKPEVEAWCSRDFNMRAEIRTAPWNVRHEKGTEEWFGWTYEFGDDYEIDENNEWLFFQVHPGIKGISPQIELMINRSERYNSSPGEVIVKNNANYPDYPGTGIIPNAGDKLDIVIHAIWGDASNGVLQVWINDAKVYDKQVATIYEEYPWGGNAKWGIYKWPWAEAVGVQKSQQQGITHMKTYMGPLRMITRKLDDIDYGKDAYALVAPN